MQMILFINDSYFAGRIAAPLINQTVHSVRLAVLSNKIRGNLPAILKIAYKSHWRYFAYRVAVDLITQFNKAMGRGSSVLSLLNNAGIPYLYTKDVNSGSIFEQLPQCDLGVTINFDQIMKKPLLNRFSKGVVNFHASRLPQDKGISPVLWAHARGDNEIWGTLYQMDEGLDSGPIYEQFSMPVYMNDTAFSVYERMCTEGGRRILNLMRSMEMGIAPEPLAQPIRFKSTYFSWPDCRHKEMLYKSGRRLMSVNDIFRALKHDSKE